MNARPKPLVLLDVDGPLNPYRLITKKGHTPLRPRHDDPEPYVYERHHLHPTDWKETGLPVLLSASHGVALRALTEHATLVWATTWEHEANAIIAPILGLPELPVIEWPDNARGWALYPRHHGSWKTKHVLTWLDEHGLDPYTGKPLPWAFVDDDLRGDDRQLVRNHYGLARGQDPAEVGAPRTLLMEIHPLHGLRAKDFADLTEWAIREGERLR